MIVSHEPWLLLCAHATGMCKHMTLLKTHNLRLWLGLPISRAGTWSCTVGFCRWVVVSRSLKEGKVEKHIHVYKGIIVLISC